MEFTTRAKFGAGTSPTFTLLYRPGTRHASRVKTKEGSFSQKLVKNIEEIIKSLTHEFIRVYWAPKKNYGMYSSSSKSTQMERKISQIVSEICPLSGLPSKILESFLQKNKI